MVHCSGSATVLDGTWKDRRGLKTEEIYLDMFDDVRDMFEICLDEAFKEQQKSNLMTERRVYES